MRRRIFHFPFSIFNSYDVVVRMPRPGVQNWGWYLGSPTHDAVALSGCAVDARGATDADASSSVTNFLSWGASEDASAGSDRFTGASRSIPVDVSVTDGRLSVACWRDLDKDGVYTVGIDARKTWTFGSSSNGKTLSISLGDMDSDGVLDSVERGEGTDPNASTNYCCNISVTYTGIFQTTNALTFVALWGDTEVSVPAVVTTKTWTHDFGHRVATRGECASVHVWDDANHNGVWDEGETGDKYDINPKGHTTCVTNELAYGHFDRNNNKLPDWWEAETLLSANGRSVKEYEDTDGDGLINLHEFWAGTNPLVPDGSNTLLSVCSRGVDDRIRDIADPSAAVSRFINFETNGRNGLFVTNTNFWAHDLDFGCVSVWHDNPPDGSGEKSATAVTRRHVVLANHWSDSSYIFFDTNGVDYIRTIVSSIRIPGTDLRLGRLNEDLPDSISVPKVLPANFSRYVGKGKYLPIVCLTHKKTASVAELATLDCSQRCSDDNITYNQLAKTEETNYVSSVRKQIRAATVDGLSGSPVFLVVDNQLVFLFSKHMGYRDRATWAPNWGPMISYHLDTIQSVINNWEGSNASRYQLNILSSADFDVIVTERSGGTQ